MLCDGLSRTIDASVLAAAATAPVSYNETQFSLGMEQSEGLPLMLCEKS